MRMVGRGIAILCLLAAASSPVVAGGLGGREFVNRFLEACKTMVSDRSLSVRLGCAEVADDPESAASLAPTLQADACRTIDAYCTGRRGGGPGVDADALADRLGCDPGATPRCVRHGGKSEPEFDMCGGRMRIEYFREGAMQSEPNWSLGLAWKDGSRWYMSDHYLPRPDPQVMQQWMRRNSRGGPPEAGYGQLVRDIVARNCATIEEQMRRSQHERPGIQKLSDLLMEWIVRDLGPHCSSPGNCFRNAPAPRLPAVGNRG